MKLQFFLPMHIPTVTHQEKKVHVVKGKPVYYEPPELKDAREKFMAYLSLHRPDEKLQGVIRLSTKWFFPVTKGHKNGEYKTTKPDTDNLIKLFKDVMTKLGYWNDDSQVASEFTEKFYGNTEGIFVQITTLEKE